MKHWNTTFMKFAIRGSLVLALLLLVLVASDHRNATPVRAQQAAKSISISVFRLGNAADLWTKPIIRRHLNHTNNIWFAEAGRIWNWNGLTINNLADPAPNPGDGDVRHPEQDETEVASLCAAAFLHPKYKPGTLPVILVNDFVDAAGVNKQNLLGWTRFKGGLGVPKDKDDPGECVLLSYQAHIDSGGTPNPKPGHTLAHEFGHVLCLPHAADHNQEHPGDIAVLTDNLMYPSKFIPGGGVKGQDLTTIQVQQTQDCLPNFTEEIKEFKPSVGGIAELAEEAGMPLETSGSSGTNAGILAGVAGIIAAATAGAVGLAGAAWYARKRGLG